MNKAKLAEMPVMAGDVIRLIADLSLHGLAFVPAALAFFWLWGLGAWWARLIAFAAAYAALAIAFPLVVLLFTVIFVPRITPGTCPMRSRQALRWIVAESMMLIVQRSFLRGYVDDFGPQRYLIYRALGARIDRTFFLGGGATILDPWALEVGRNVVIGSQSLISGHAIEGDALTVQTVRIGDGATVGMRSVVLPGAVIEAGAIVAAGAVVAKNVRIPAGEIWGGVPARKIGEVAAGQPESGEDRL
jgi:acetyltransferase-like isoleucine patch superfamily enzyme